MSLVCAFDLDHTLVGSPLDLPGMRADIRALAVAERVDLPAAAVGWTVAETIAAIRARRPDLEPGCWAIALEHETRALAAAVPEPGAAETLAALRAAGVAIAVWTNNTRPASEAALRRCGLRDFVLTLVTRDEAALKPDPGGLIILRAAHPNRPVWVVGDSWIDGAAALAGGASFIAYRTDPQTLARRGVVARAALDDLRRLPGWLAAHAL